MAKGYRRKGSRRSLRQGATAGSLLGLPLLAHVSWAQQASSSVPVSGGDIQEIVVTAQRREQSLQDVPISVTALQGSVLEERGATGFADYLREVPGVSFVPLGPGLSQLNIRGVETQPVARDQPGVKPSVGMYLDDTPLSTAFFNPDLDIFDMERVEVLRGPQGTLFGSASLAGTVRFVTNKPKNDVWEAEADAGYGSIDHAGTDYDAKGMINIPLIPGRMALRVVAYENQDGGYINQVQTHYDGKTYGISGSDVNEVRKDGFRAELGITGDHFTAVFTGLHQTINAGGYPLEDIITPNIPVTNGAAMPYTVPVSTGPYQQFREWPENHQEDISLFSSALTFDLDFASLTSDSSYTTRHIADERDYTINSDYEGPAYAYPGPLVDHSGISSFSQELRIASQGKNALDWIGGAFYSSQTRTYNQYLYQPGIDAALGINSTTYGVPADTLYNAEFNIPYSEAAAFAEATYHFTPAWGLTLGGREYEYNESVTSAYMGYFGSDNGLQATTSSKANGLNPRIIVSYKPVEDYLFSAQASKGFRLGSSNDRIPVQVCGETSAPPQYGPEHVWNYELDAKTRFADGHVTLNAALYEIKYTDIQLNARLTCSFSFIENGSSARSRGAEVELWLRPLDGLSVSFNGTYLDARLTSALPIEVQGLLPGVGDGSRLPGSPRQTYNVSTDYVSPIKWARFSPYIGLTYQSVGGIKTYIQDPDSLDTHRYTLGTAQLGLRSDRLDFALHVDNIWNEIAQLSLERSSVGQYSYSINPPRTIGFAVRARY